MKPPVTAAAPKPQAEPEAPAAAPSDPASTVTPRSEAKRSAPETPQDKAKAGPTPPQPVAKALQPAESSDPKGPPLQARRPAPDTGGRADASLDAMRGRYVGSYVDTASGQDQPTGFTLVISGVENGIAKGTASLGGRDCNGDYPMQGSYRNGKLELRATRMGGPAGDCPLNLTLAAQGNQLVGAMDNGNPVRLRK